MKQFTIYNLQFIINLMRKLSFKYFVFGLLAIISFAYYILHTTYYIPPAFATTQSCPTQSPNPRVKEGLISASSITRNANDPIKFSQEKGICVVDDERASFVSYKIPTYDSLKAQYFDNSTLPPAQKITLTGDQTQTGPITPINLSIANTNKVHHITGNLTINPNVNISVNSTGVIFVDGDLTINTNLTHSGNVGLVFVVKGNIIVAPSVIRIDAVLISSGIIRTAGATCSTSAVTASQLVINGSLISIYRDSQQPGQPLIKFCRKLADNAQAAEQINQQPKYLVILKDIVADTLQTWSEIP